MLDASWLDNERATAALRLARAPGTWAEQQTEAVSGLQALARAADSLKAFLRPVPLAEADLLAALRGMPANSTEQASETADAADRAARRVPTAARFRRGTPEGAASGPLPSDRAFAARGTPPPKSPTLRPRDARLDNQAGNNEVNVATANELATSEFEARQALCRPALPVESGVRAALPNGDRTTLPGQHLTALLRGTSLEAALSQAPRGAAGSTVAANVPSNLARMQPSRMTGGPATAIRTLIESLTAQSAPEADGEQSARDSRGSRSTANALRAAILNDVQRGAISPQVSVSPSSEPPRADLTADAAADRAQAQHAAALSHNPLAELSAQAPADLLRDLSAEAVASAANPLSPLGLLADLSGNEVTPVSLAQAAESLAASGVSRKVDEVRRAAMKQALESALQPVTAPLDQLLALARTDSPTVSTSAEAARGAKRERDTATAAVSGVEVSTAAGGESPRRNGWRPRLVTQPPHASAGPWGAGGTDREPAGLALLRETMSHRPESLPAQTRSNRAENDQAMSNAERQPPSPPPAIHTETDLAPMSTPATQTTFNVTVHVTGALGGNEDELAERLSRILVDQARRYGIDV